MPRASSSSNGALRVDRGRVVHNPLIELQRWYEAQCDGDWEHTYGVQIDTLDNPGWSVEIHVEGTALAEAPFDSAKVERSERDWLTCWVGMPDRPNPTGVQALAFRAACGPENLSEVLGIFLDWARRSAPWDARDGR